MFLLDHHNYARWLPVHIRSMINLGSEHPEVYQEFLKGNFTAQISNRKVSRIGLDHNHEQINSKIRCYWVDRKQHCSKRWLISGPEVSHLIEQFEPKADGNHDEIVLEHHDSSLSTQQRFQGDIVLLGNVLDELGNPFIDNSEYLYALDTKEVVNADRALLLYSAEKIVQTQFNEYSNSRFIVCSKAVTNTIPKNKFSMFGRGVASNDVSQKEEKFKATKAKH